MRTNERCACGLPLHYTNKETEAQVKKQVAELGEYIPVNVAGERYLVQRHYIALHGLKGAELEDLVKKGIARRG